ncbi:MAG TPA: hypothetical protein DCY94_02395 [Firmicutes bacterium]|nr:hypothetical protein [Bacillota bacterium]
MTGDKELLEYLNENITVGLEALKTLSKKMESTDNKIKSNVDKASREYESFAHRLKELSNEEVPVKKENLFSVMMAKMGTNTEFMKDNSDSKIAETLIQGYNMGLLDITKKLKKYKGDISKDVLELANDYKKMMHDGAKDIKGFL